ncbi:MAG: hypothetical protein JSR82_17705 [Verrucomicrobia bacterium]|nr:hypothetical protein [Verrucomicrobiota bacterium]
MDDFADSQTCALIDWRAEPEEVVEALQAFLPDDFLRLAEADESSLTVVMASRRTKVELQPELPAIPLADELVKLLPPEHFGFLLRSSLHSDTAAYVVRPAAWWHRFQRLRRDRFGQLFTEDRRC